MKPWILMILMGGGGSGADVNNLLLQTGSNVLLQDGSSVLKLQA